MWVALGQCYEAEPLGQLDAAVRCYRRAAACGDKEGLALHKLVRVGGFFVVCLCGCHGWALTLSNLNTSTRTNTPPSNKTQQKSQ